MSRSPGPWRPGEGGHDNASRVDLIVDKDGRSVLLADTGQGAAFVEVSDADLALMVAAPLMLEALKEARYWLIKAGGWSGTDYVDIPCSEVVDAAIAAAEGGAA